MRSKAKKACFLIVFFAILVQKAAAQNDELPERLAQKSASRPDFDIAEWAEKDAADPASQLDPNAATRADLENFGFLEIEKIDAFLAHRQRLGPFESIFELQAIDGWTLADCEKVAPFFKKTLDRKTTRLTRKLLFGRGGNEILARWGHVFDAEKWAAEHFEGSPDALFLRFRRRAQDGLSLGFAVEKDAGERLGGPKNRLGFDHATAHFFIKNPAKRVKTLALGDFLTGFGQGLVLAGGLGATRSREVLDIKTSGQRLRPKTTATEDFFLRGAAAEFQFSKNWTASFFASSRRRDAVLADSTAAENGAFSSFSVGGVHRNEAEIRNEKTVRERLAGASLGFEKPLFQLHLNAFAVGWDRFLEPPARADLAFQKRANSLILSSLDHSENWRGLHFFGENAVASSGGFAFLNGLVAPLSRRATASFSHRHFSKKYAAPHARAFSESGEPRNERGVFLGLEIRPVQGWRLQFYADRWRDAWLAFSEKSLGGGQEFLAAAEFSVRKKWTASARFRLEQKGADRFVFSKNGGRKKLQFRLDQRVSQTVRWQTRLDFFGAASGPIGSKKGFLALQTLIFEPKSANFWATARLGVFETDGFGSRIFVHERHLEESQFVPFFYGRGARFFGSVGWRGSRFWRLEAFVGRTKTREPEREVWELKIQAKTFF